MGRRAWDGGHGAQRGDGAGGCGRAGGGVRNATRHLAEARPSAPEGRAADLSGEPVSLAAPRWKPRLDSCGGRCPPFLPLCSQSRHWGLRRAEGGGQTRQPRAARHGSPGSPFCVLTPDLEQEKPATWSRQWVRTNPQQTLLFPAKDQARALPAGQEGTKRPDQADPRGCLDPLQHRSRRTVWARLLTPHTYPAQR